MTTEDTGTLPTPQSPDVDPLLFAGLGIAQRWGAALSADKLDVAFKALEPQLKRDHKERLIRLEMQREEAERASSERERAHKRYMAGLIVGAVVAISMLAGGVYVAESSAWLAAMFCGPSLLALVRIFVLRRSDSDDARHVGAATRNATSAAAQGQPPAPPVV